LEALRGATRATPYGDPRDPLTISGPVIHAGARQKIESKLQGFGDRCESTQPIGNQAILAPTLVEISGEKQERSALVQEEVFGPVMTARPFRSTDELLTLAGSGRYGLQAGIFTQNLAVIEGLFRDLEVGGLVVNDVPTSRYDHQPYGGMKESGQGREGVKYAMDEMTESKFLALSSSVAL
jgi:acyl-CoA reductase-like NAD-dependent aldehyde dehydrogenase